MSDLRAPMQTPPAEKPLATYTERLLEVRRQFRLYRDRVTVEARWLFKGVYHTTVRLDHLQPEWQPYQVRYRLHRWAGWVLAVGALFTAFAVYAQKPPPWSLPALIGLSIAAAGLLGVALTYRNKRIVFARFRNTDGKPALDVRRPAGGARAFDEFVQRITAQARKSRSR